MKITIDTTEQTLTTEDGPNRRSHGLYTKESFELLSQEWLRVGWSLRQYFTFSWFGCPVVQLPEDMIRLQEVIYQIKPDVIIETGVYRGGSLMFLATLCKAAERGRVIGIDVKIPGEERGLIESHMLAPLITLIESDSVAPDVVQQVAGQINDSDTVLVILDSSHTKAHVLAELRQYSPFVTAGSYIVATDGVMKDLAAVPGGEPRWATDNPAAAAAEFAASHPEFEAGQPPWLFHDSELTENVTYWPGGWLRRVS